jgi:transposase
MKTQDTRKLPAKTKETIRIRAVQAVLDGRTQVEVAKIFGVTRQSVGNWMKAYHENGLKALKAKKLGRKKGGKLLPWQAAQTAKIVIDRHPEQLKFPWGLWTRKSVGELIYKKFGIRLSRWTVGRYLKRWGFTPQKPVRKAYEKNPKAVKKWLEKDYPEIREKARNEHADIFWGDESGLRSEHFVGRTYGKKGKTPEIPCTAKRFGCNMISAIANTGKLYFMVFKEKFSSDIFIEFMDRLVRKYPRKVFLIVDNHSVHTSRKTKEWIKEHSEDISIFYLPTYSPELNPDELLNQDVKSNSQKTGRANNKEELMSKTRSFLRKRQKQPHVVKRYFMGKHVQYAA